MPTGLNADPSASKEDTVHNTSRLIFMIALAASLGPSAASAQDLLKLAIGQRGIWHGATADG